MKIRNTIFIYSILILLVSELSGQSISNNNLPILPLKSASSLLFAEDIIIHDQPDRNQRSIAVCSAFNGWLYAVYSYFNDSCYQEAAVILRSKDNGDNWSVLLEGCIGMFHNRVEKLDILVCGQDTVNIKLFVGFFSIDSTTTNTGLAIVRYNKDGVVENQVFYGDSEIRDFAMSGDDLYPATNSNPFSVGFIYSKGTNNKDSIIFLSSSNGGMSFNKKYRIASSTHYLHKVALAYGQSPSFNSGRYFAAWEEQDNENSVSGHIYTAHSEPNFNSPFTKAVCLDSLYPSAINNVRNPVIACQNNEADNDSSNLTEVLLFEKYLPSTQEFTIAGLYNKKATVSDNFQPFTIDASVNNKLQPDICFNPFDSTFIVTYFDSTAQKLPYCIQNFNMMYPDTWNVLSPGYNDDNNLIAPHPQVAMDYWTHTGANAWIGSRSGGNGVAMFDAPFIYYTGDQEKNSDKNKLKVKVFPNPATEFAILEFELPRTANVKITILSTVGQPLSEINYPYCIPGKHQVKVDLSKYNPGIYILTLKAGESFSSGKISVTR
jgi:hypothetical protein